MFDSLRGDFSAIQLRHGDIENGEIGLELLTKIQGFPSIACLAHDFNARFVFEQGSQAAPDNVVVIR